MADFRNFEVDIDAESDFSDDDDIIDENASDKSFINADNEIDESRDFYRQFAKSRDFYRQFANVKDDLEQVLVDA